MMYGSRKDQQAKPKATKEEKQILNSIFYRQRKIADQRAIEHINPNPKQLVDVDPLPELPQDHVLYGSAAFLGPQMTSYRMQFQNPQAVIYDRKVEAAAFKDGNLEELLMERAEA